MKEKKLNGKGEVNYDFQSEILFFKASEGEYETENIVLDVDSEGFIVGIQIFEASSFLNLSKHFYESRIGSFRLEYMTEEWKSG